MALDYNIFFRYADETAFLTGFDTEFGTPLLGWTVGGDKPKAYGYKMAQEIVERIHEAHLGGEDLLALEIIPAFMFEKHFSGKVLEKSGR